MEIREILPADIDLYAEHRLRSSAESGKGNTPVFMLPPSELNFFDKEKDLKRLQAPIGEAPFKRSWGAFLEGSKIIGNMEVCQYWPHSEHRILFTLAIEEGFRKQGLGTRFLEIAISFCQEHKAEWLDAWVFGTNEPSLSLFRKNDFSEIVEKDKYRIEGISIDHHIFSRKI